MQLNLQVDDEVWVQQENVIAIETIPVDAGQINIKADEDQAGKLRISARENITLQVGIDAPDELILDAGNSIPFSWKAAYNNSGSNRPDDIIPFSINPETLPLNNSGKLIEQMLPNPGELSLLLYVYGDFFVGNIDPGVYRGEILVTIEVD